MGTKAIKLSEEFVELARLEGRLMYRSTAAQVEYWAQLGRQVEAVGVLGPAGVRRLLAGEGSVQDLGEADHALFVSLLTEKLENLDGSDTRLLEDLRSGGHSIASENEQGEIVVEPPTANVKSRRRRKA